MKNILSKVIASSMALTLVLASAVTTTSSIKTEEIPVKAPAAVHETVKPAAVEEAKAETKSDAGLLETIEQKAAEEAVVEVVKAAPEIKEEKAAPEIREEKAAPVVATAAEVAQEVAAPAPVIEEAEEIAEPAPVIEETVEAEPVKVWDVSATENDNVSMKFYANNSSIRTDVTTGEVIISGTGEMEEGIYQNFVTVERYVAATTALFEKTYGVKVDAVYDEGITDIIELEYNIKYYALEDGNGIKAGDKLRVTNEMRENLDPSEFLAFSPTKVTIEEGITNVSNFAFVFCGELKEVVLPKTIEYIGDCAFMYCSNLNSITVPEDVTSGVSPFAYCNSLSTVILADEAYYENLAAGIVAEDAGATLTTEEINAMVEGY